jgi:signal transduction histidine kinase
MVSRRTAHPGSGVVYLKLADIALPPNIWIKVVTGSGKQEMIAERLQKTLLIFEIVGGVILMALLLYLISVPVASLKQTSNMIRQLKRGATASFIENANHAVSQIIAIEEVNQIRQDTIELSTVLDQAVTERVLRSIAETRAEEKKSALSKAAHEFELERKQLAQEFHDDLGQRMTAIRYQLAMLQKASTPTSTKEQITAITQSIVKMESSITSILDGLHPPLIDSLGILGAISAVVREMTEANRRKCTYDVVVSEKVGESAVAIQIALFRIVQESINNALKYARPSHIRIRIEYSKTEEHLLEGSIYNDGGGFDQSEVGAGRGLSGMEERVMRLGGQFSIKSSSQEEETTVSFSIPVA